MHASDRERIILQLLSQRGFVSFQELDQQLEALPATLRRDLHRLESAGQIVRVRGVAKLTDDSGAQVQDDVPKLTGAPFHQNIMRNHAAKRAIGRAAAALCRRGESIIIDGGSTPLQMCPHLDGLDLQVLSNALHIIDALLPQAGTRIAVPRDSSVVRYR